MDHRRTPSRKAYVLPDWLIVATVLAAIGATVFLGLLMADRLLGDDPEAPPVATPTPTQPTDASPEPSPEPTEPEPTQAEPEPTPEPTEPAVVGRDASVSVFNNTTVAGLASTYAQRARNVGWAVPVVGNWRGTIPSNTVYFPPGFEESAQLLGQDLGITRILPSVEPMRTDGLTVVLSGPQ